MTWWFDAVHQGPGAQVNPGHERMSGARWTRFSDVSVCASLPLSLSVFLTCCLTVWTVPFRGSPSGSASGSPLKSYCSCRSARVSSKFCPVIKKKKKKKRRKTSTDPARDTLTDCRSLKRVKTVNEWMTIVWRSNSVKAFSEATGTQRHTILLTCCLISHFFSCFFLYSVTLLLFWTLLYFLLQWCPSCH